MRRLLSELKPTTDTKNSAEMHRILERVFSETVAEERLPLSRTERVDLCDQIAAARMPQSRTSWAMGRLSRSCAMTP